MSWPSLLGTMINILASSNSLLGRLLFSFNIYANDFKKYRQAKSTVIGYGAWLYCIRLATANIRRHLRKLTIYHCFLRYSLWLVCFMIEFACPFCLFCYQSVETCFLTNFKQLRTLYCKDENFDCWPVAYDIVTVAVPWFSNGLWPADTQRGHTWEQERDRAK